MYSVVFRGLLVVWGCFISLALYHSRPWGLSRRPLALAAFKLSPKPRTDAVAQDVECQAAPLRWRKVREGVRVLSSNGVCYSRACPAWPAASAKNVFSLDCGHSDWLEDGPCGRAAAAAAAAMGDIVEVVIQVGFISADAADDLVTSVHGLDAIRQGGKKMNHSPAPPSPPAASPESCTSSTRQHTPIADRHRPSRARLRVSTPP